MKDYAKNPNQQAAASGENPSDSTCHHLKPRSDTLDTFRDGSSDVRRDLGSIGTQFQPVVDESKQRGEGPYNGPDGDVAELSDHLGVVYNTIMCTNQHTTSGRGGANSVDSPVKLE